MIRLPQYKDDRRLTFRDANYLKEHRSTHKEQPTALLPYCLTALLPYCLTALLPYCLTALLPYCLTALLPYCLTALLPYCLTALSTDFP